MFEDSYPFKRKLTTSLFGTNAIQMTPNNEVSFVSLVSKCEQSTISGLNKCIKGGAYRSIGSTSQMAGY